MSLILYFKKNKQLNIGYPSINQVDKKNLYHFYLQENHLVRLSDTNAQKWNSIFRHRHR
jgi:hypothetical protein